jgi:hypothetical protein
VLFALCYRVLGWILQFAALRVRSTDFKDLELVVLRHELAILRRHSRRPRMTWTDRMFLAAASRLLPRTRWRSFIVTPATLLALWSAIILRGRFLVSSGLHQSIFVMQAAQNRGRRDAVPAGETMPRRLRPV